LAAEIIEIGDLRFSRNRIARAYRADQCKHHRLRLDENGDVVVCEDCGIQVSAFWALCMLADEFDREFAKLRSARANLAREKAAEVHLLAARKVDAVWRSRTMVPACPHCGIGVLPEDGLGNARISREMELRRREVAQKTKESQ
jgi:DNA-directed RNA polymerase subunit RPC12/RpoP